jgi:hypothetical protein
MYHLLKWNPRIIQVGMESQNHLLKFGILEFNLEIMNPKILKPFKS